MRREVLHGKVWSEMPTRVVVDEPELLAVFVEPGSRLTYPDHHHPHPWDKPERGFWRGHGKLMLHRPQDAYSVDLFWKGDERVFGNYYLNLQAPYRRVRGRVRDARPRARLHDGPGRDVGAARPRRVRGAGRERQVLGGGGRGDQGRGLKIEKMLASGDIWWDTAWADWRPPGLAVKVRPLTFDTLVAEIVSRVGRAPRPGARADRRRTRRRTGQARGRARGTVARLGPAGAAGVH